MSGTSDLDTGAAMGGDLVSIPNGDIRTVTNRTREWARINLEIGIADADRLSEARAAIDRAGRELAADPDLGPAVIEAPRFVMVTDIGEDGIRVLIWGRVRASERFAVEGDYRRRLLEALDQADVELVTAQRVDLVRSPSRTGPWEPPGRLGP